MELAGILHHGASPAGPVADRQDGGHDGGGAGRRDQVQGGAVWTSRPALADAGAADAYAGESAIQRGLAASGGRETPQAASVAGRAASI